MLRMIGVTLRLFLLLLVGAGMAALGIFSGQQIALGQPFTVTENEVARYAEAWTFDSGDAVRDGTFDRMDWQPDEGFVPDETALAAGLAGRYRSPVLTAKRPVRAVVAEWSATPAGEAGVRLAVRWRTDGAWSRWVEFSTEDDMHATAGQFSQNGRDQRGGGNFYLESGSNSPVAEFSTPLLVPAVETLQLRVEVEPGTVLHRVTLGALAIPESVDTLALEERAVRLPNGGPLVIPRSEWGRELGAVRWRPEANEPRAIVVHHTATSAGGDDPAAVVRMIDVYHRNTRSWGDIGYHYLIDHQGRIYEGRKGGPVSVGAHAYNFNNGTVGIALVGTYEKEPISPAARESLISLIGWLSGRFEIDPEGTARFHDRSYPTIIGHRDTGRATTCPGDRLWNELPQLRKLVAKRLAGIRTPAPPGIELAPPSEWIKGTINVLIDHESLMPVELALHLNNETLHVSEDPFQYPIDSTALEDGEHLLVGIARHGDQVTKSERILQVDNSAPAIETTAPTTPREAAVLITDEGSRLHRIELRRRNSDGQWEDWIPVEAPYPTDRFDQQVPFGNGTAVQWRAVDGAGNESMSPVVERPAAEPTAGPTTTPAPTATPAPETALAIESVEYFPARPGADAPLVLQVIVVNQGDRPTGEPAIVELVVNDDQIIRWRIDPGLSPRAMALLRSDRETLPDSTFAGRLPAGEHRVVASIPDLNVSFDPVTVSITESAPPTWERVWEAILSKLRRLGAGG